MNILHVLGTNLKEGDGITSSVKALVLSQNLIKNVKSDYITVSKKSEDKNKIINLYKLTCDIKRGDVNIVVFHGIYFLEFLKIYNILRKYSIPYIITPHGGLKKIYQKKKIIQKLIANFIFYKFLKNAKKIVYVSNGEMKDSKKLNKSFLIQKNGLLENKIYILNKKEKKNNINVLFLSRIDYHYKGIDTLLIKLSQIKDYLEENNIYFKLYGREAGNAKGSVEKLNNHLKQINCNNIEYCGAIYGEAKEEVYKDADLFILPSRSEGLPMVVLEALSFGLPCILTKETNILEEVIQYKCGWELTLNDSKNDLKEALEKYKELDKEQLNIDIKKLLLEEFNLKQIAKQSIEEYKKILD